VSGTIWFTSDTHFRHAMVAQLRGFASAEEHDEAVIARWNDTVRPGDTVWHLGDVGMSRGFLPLLGRLHGTIHLITGNHDAAWPGHRDSHRHQREWLEHFASVQAFARRKIGARHVLLSHFPRTGDHTEVERHDQYRLRSGELPVLHGHTHSRERGGGAQIHVGLDAWDLRPVALHVLEHLITTSEADAAAVADAPERARTST
jgi:calcineurin-like phosphoesterase family protein